jgi:site-specific DNA-methyltransferase (adenine-specific)
MKTIPDKSVDAIITDPPYGTTACKWDSVIDFDLMWKQLNRTIKPNGAIVLFGSEPFSSALRMSNIKNYKYDWTWNKNKISNPMLAKKQPLRCIENIIVFAKNTPIYNPIMESKPKNSQRKILKTEKYIKGRERKDGVFSTAKNGMANDYNYKLSYPKNYINISGVHNSKTIHPTQKPVALMEYLIKTYTKENETVLDFTMGSGSTGVACENTKRNFIGIEKDEKYFNIAEKRIRETKQQTTLF